eukprot:TRINITY_DN903_c0_g1_i1.p1 TRINITY_DN903_c0_g1~~TRINITY_DN903_c0_g1_i1.p1  ORF type:complete len:996 (+),score=233.56 TRINITY_DN903_c0_g1_i1:98-3085(+)
MDTSLKIPKNFPRPFLPKYLKPKGSNLKEKIKDVQKSKNRRIKPTRLERSKSKSTLRLDKTADSLSFTGKQSAKIIRITHQKKARARLRWAQVKRILPYVAAAGRQDIELPAFLRKNAIDLSPIMHEVAATFCKGSYNPEISDVLHAQCVDIGNGDDSFMSARGKHRSRAQFLKRVDKNSMLIEQEKHMRNSQNEQVKNTKLFRAYFERAFVHQRLNNLKAALDDYSNCIRIDSSVHLPYFNRAIVLQQLGDLTGATKDLTIAIRLSPDIAESYENRALVLRQLGSYGEATQDYLTAKKLREEGRCQPLMPVIKRSGDTGHMMESIVTTALIHNRPFDSSTLSPSVQKALASSTSFEEFLDTMPSNNDNKTTNPKNSEINSSTNSPMHSSRSNRNTPRPNSPGTPTVTGGISPPLLVPIVSRKKYEITYGEKPTPPPSADRGDLPPIDKNMLSGRRKRSVVALAADSMSKADGMQQFLIQHHMKKLKTMLASNPQDRQQEDLEFIMSVIGGLQFFKNMPQDVAFRLSKLLHFEEVAGGHFVFRQGDPGDKYYIVLKGHVSVLVYVNENHGENVKKQLYIGDSFGDAALHSKTVETRTASIKAQEDSAFLTLHRDDYLTVINLFNAWINSDRARVLNDCFIFERWSDEDILKLAAASQVKRFEAGCTIIRQAEKVSGLFIIKKGIVRLVKTVHVASEHCKHLQKRSQRISNDDEDPAEDVGKYGFRGASLALFSALPTATTQVTSSNDWEYDDAGDNKLSPSHSAGQSPKFASSPTPTASKNSTPSSLLSNSAASIASALASQRKTSLTPKTIETAPPIDITPVASDQTISSGPVFRGFGHLVQELQKRRGKQLQPLDVTTAILHSGHYFGENCVLDAVSDSPITVLSDTKVECLHVPVNELRPFRQIWKETGSLHQLEQSLHLNGSSVKTITEQFIEKQRWEKLKTKIVNQCCNLPTPTVNKRIRAQAQELKASGQVYRPRSLSLLADGISSKPK